ncbi:MAG: S8 family serine peptidase [Gammaproteobacteria bacterium]
MGRRIIVRIALLLLLTGPAGAATADSAGTGPYACRALSCSTLIPGPEADDPTTNDCGYRNGNEWWVDYVAGSLAWNAGERHNPITVALFDDGAATDHPELRNQLWTNEAEANGKPGVDDDANGYVDDVHGWDFVDGDAVVSPQGECVGRVSHGTLMASLIAAERNNGVGIAAAGSDGARVMVLRIAGCSGRAKDRADPERIARAIDYAARMGAKILNFSAHWPTTTPELDAAFARVADNGSSTPAIVVAAVPNKGEAVAGYPAAYTFPRIVRAVPIGNDDIISPGTSPAPPGINLGAPSACVLGASAGSAGYRIEQGSSNSAAILSGLLAGVWSSPRYARFPADEFLAKVVRGQMSQSPRRSQPDPRGGFPKGVPLADACTLAMKGKSARVCLKPGTQRGPSE